MRYRLECLLDQPDELRSQEIGLLDQGDEVELLERFGAYWRVLCPDGREGWLHRMTLGDRVGDVGEEPETAWPSRYAAREDVDPERDVLPGSNVQATPALAAADMAEEPLQEDVLMAYLNSRRRRAS